MSQRGDRIERTGEDGLTVGSERNRLDAVLVQERPAGRLAGWPVPEPGRMVLAAGEQGLPVRAKATAEIQSLMHERMADRLAGSCIPQSGRLVPTARQHALAVGAVSRRRDQVFVTHRFTDRLAVGGVPQPGGHVGTSRENGGAVGTESDGRDGIVVAKHGLRALPECTSQSLAERSSLPVSKVCPSGLNASDPTFSSCRSGAHTVSPVSTAITCTRPSAPAQGEQSAVATERGGLDRLGMFKLRAQWVNAVPPGREIDERRVRAQNRWLAVLLRPCLLARAIPGPRSPRTGSGRCYKPRGPIAG